jgi:hypothetical protein
VGNPPFLYRPRGERLENLPTKCSISTAKVGAAPPRRLRYTPGAAREIRGENSRAVEKARTKTLSGSALAAGRTLDTRIPALREKPEGRAAEQERKGNEKNE